MRAFNEIQNAGTFHVILPQFYVGGRALLRTGVCGIRVIVARVCHYIHTNERCGEIVFKNRYRLKSIDKTKVCCITPFLFENYGGLSKFRRLG